MLKWSGLTFFTLIFIALLPASSFAGIGMASSELTLVDTLRPTLELDNVDDNILLPAGGQMTFHWTTGDQNPGITPDDFIATVWIDQQPQESITYYPDIDEFTWTWTAPEVQTSECHLEVVVKDLLGNTTSAITSNFTVLLSTTAVGETPSVISLQAPYPNPFNPSCELAFSLPVAGDVDLAVFDTRGRRVKNLMQGHMAAGNTRLRWDGTDQQGRPQSGGLYFFVLKTNGPDGPVQLVRKASLIP